MPLSDDEQRKFDEIEHALHDEDPRFSTTITIAHLRRRRTLAAVAYFCGGILLLMAGLVSTQGSVALGVMISVAGFLTMVWAVALYLRRQPR